MRSWLYCPADSPRKMVNAGIYGADGIVFDLEDSVKAEAKDQARILLAEMLKSTDYGKSVLAVRINGLGSKFWKEDIAVLIPVVKVGKSIAIRVPKMETPEEVAVLTEYLASLEEEAGITSGTIKLQIIFETPLGVENAFKVTSAADRIQAVSFGSEDYCTALGIDRYGAPFALDYARNRIASAAAAFGVEAYDTVWGAYKDQEGLKNDAVRGRQLGFCGKSVIHPDQVSVVNAVFSPSEAEIAWAQKVLAAVEGSAGGAVGLDGVMVDKPVIRRAKRILGVVFE